MHTDRFSDISLSDRARIAAGWRWAVALVAGVLLLAGAGSAHAVSTSSLQLSDRSSDSTPAELLDALFEFTVSDSNMTLEITNQTSEPNAYFINEAYFNATDDVESLTATLLPDDWSFATDESAAGFGTFDYALLGPVGNNENQIGPGETETFEFSFTGTGVTASDFTSEFSTIPPGNRPAFAAAKFVRGPGDDSAFGAVIPTPASTAIGVVAFGLLGVGGRHPSRNRRAA